MSKKSPIIFFVVFFLILIILGAFLYSYGIVKPEKKKNENGGIQSKNILTPKNIEIPSKPSSFLPEKIKKEVESMEKNKENFITPKNYNIGLMTPPDPYCSVDNCNPNVLYPIQQPGVDYGSEACVNGPCTEFIRSP